MPYNSENGIISAPVSIDDVKQALGESSNDLATLCKSDNINMWSLYKPVAGKDIYEDAMYKGGLTITNISLKELSMWFEINDDRSCKYIYEKPYGGEKSPYRLGDFRGYFHKAICQFYLEVYNGPIDCEYTYDHTDIVLHTNRNLPINNVHITDIFDIDDTYLSCAIFDDNYILQNMIIEPFNITNRPDRIFYITRDDIRFGWHKHGLNKNAYFIPCVITKISGNHNTRIFPIPIMIAENKYNIALNEYSFTYSPRASVEESSKYISNNILREDFKDEYEFMDMGWNFKGYFKINVSPTNHDYYLNTDVILKGIIYSSKSLRISARDIYYTVEGMEIINYSGIYCADNGAITNIGTTDNNMSSSNYFTIPANTATQMRFFLLNFYNYGDTDAQDIYPIDGVYRVSIYVRLKSTKQIICSFFNLVFKQTKSYIGEPVYVEGTPY